MGAAEKGGVLISHLNMVFWEIRIAKETWAQDVSCLTKSSYPLMLLFEYSLKGNKVHHILFIVYIWLILHHCTHKWVGALISFISLLFRVMQAASLKKWIPYAGVFALLKNTPVFYCTDTGHLRFVVLFLSDTRWFLRQLLGGKRGTLSAVLLVSLEFRQDYEAMRRSPLVEQSPYPW